MSLHWQIEPLTAWPLAETKPRKASELDHLNIVGAVAVQVVDGDRALWDRVEAARARLIADGRMEAS